MSDKLREIADTLDRILGDTDPHIEPDWTDEEIQREYPIFWSCRELYKMTSSPKHETVEQWEDRTGETYPDDGPVWIKVEIDHMTRAITPYYELQIYEDCQSLINHIIVANHHGKPNE